MNTAVALPFTSAVCHTPGGLMAYSPGRSVVRTSLPPISCTSVSSPAVQITTSWEGWEVHPNGHEVEICTAGELTLVQEIVGKEVRTTLRPGEYAINPPGVWHTADENGSATAVFITAGSGTEGRPRR